MSWGDLPCVGLLGEVTCFSLHPPVTTCAPGFRQSPRLRLPSLPSQYPGELLSSAPVHSPFWQTQSLETSVHCVLVKGVLGEGGGRNPSLQIGTLRLQSKGPHDSLKAETPQHQGKGGKLPPWTGVQVWRAGGGVDHNLPES